MGLFDQLSIGSDHMDHHNLLSESLCIGFAAGRLPSPGGNVVSDITLSPTSTVGGVLKLIGHSTMALMPAGQATRRITSKNKKRITTTRTACQHDAIKNYLDP